MATLYIKLLKPAGNNFVNRKIKSPLNLIINLQSTDLINDGSVSHIFLVKPTTFSFRGQESSGTFPLNLHRHAVS